MKCLLLVLTIAAVLQALPAFPGAKGWGTETVGGFACDRYKVNGTVGDQVITGTIWVDPEAFALIKAELHVPAALLAAPDEPASGEVKVTLNVEKADVPAVQLPAAPAGGEVQPTAMP